MYRAARRATSSKDNRKKGGSKGVMHVVLTSSTNIRTQFTRLQSCCVVINTTGERIEMQSENAVSIMTHSVVHAHVGPNAF